jgi:terminase small subunit / prophage DNA-packing protein
MLAKAKGQIVSRAGISEMWGVALTTVDAWVRAGCPVVQRGSRGVEWAFNTADVAKWRENRAAEQAVGKGPLDEEELKKRKLAAETALAELELAKAKALVAPLDQVERMVSRAFAEVRTGVRNVPGRVVSLLIGETDERRFKQVLREELDQALEALANADLAGSDEEGDGDEADG